MIGVVYAIPGTCGTARHPLKRTGCDGVSVVTASYRLERLQRVPRPLPEVFAFFADAANLEELTPGFLRFRILTPKPIVLGAGSLIDYQLTLLGIPFHWRTRIETFDPPGPGSETAGFSDIQLTGPYARWHHRHEFQAVSGGTDIRDVVDYALPLGPLGMLAHALFVRRQLDAIFEYRRQRCAQRFG
jgi:ligand-binding SRPBCC domain-containing protein